MVKFARLTTHTRMNAGEGIPMGLSLIKAEQTEVHIFIRTDRFGRRNRCRTPFWIGLIVFSSSLAVLLASSSSRTISVDRLNPQHDYLGRDLNEKTLVGGFPENLTARQCISKIQRL